MNFLRNLSPLRGIRDLRVYLSRRKPYELWFLLLALVVTGGIWGMFLKDSQFEKPYRPNIIYFDNWLLTRSDAEIIAKQKIDQVERDKAQAEIDRKRKARQEEYKKIDDGLNKWGL